MLLQRVGGLTRQILTGQAARFMSRNVMIYDILY